MKGERLAAFLGLTSGTVGLFAMVALVGLGERMAERFLPVYLLLPSAAARWRSGCCRRWTPCCRLFMPIPAAGWPNGWARRRTLTLVNGLAIAGYLVVILVPRWEAVLAGAILFIAWSAVSLPATMGLIARMLPRNKHTMGVTLRALVRRIPVALGPLLGGAAIAIAGEEAGVRLAFVVALVLAVLGSILYGRLVPDDRSLGGETLPLGVRGTFRLMPPRN
ncbi:MAG: major facilitator superfamily protein [Rhodospirillaceae bacterium]|nr:MAG: major facilitator superfamily protein [Rhodospirillaceae bacterium]